MIRGIRPLLRGSTYSGMLFACCGALASLPLLPFALLPTLAWPSAPYGMQTVLVLLIWAALIGSAGLARTTWRWDGRGTDERRADPHGDRPPRGTGSMPKPG